MPLFCARLRENYFHKGVKGVVLKKVVGQALLEAADFLEGRIVGRRVKLGLTLIPNEVGVQEIVDGAAMAIRGTPGLQVILIGPQIDMLPVVAGDKITHIATGKQEKDIHLAMERLLQSKEIDAAVTMHYNFPLGVATVGRIISPGKGKEIFLATTTGTADIERTKAMIKNVIAGIACAKACGRKHPRVGILNIEGARACERALQQLKARGYALEFAESIRSDGSPILRGNDLLAGSCDVVVTDSLTGNILMKILSAFTTGGQYEAMGYGYGPGIGEGYSQLIGIISRASGAPVVARALRYLAEVTAGGVLSIYQQELAAAKKAGLEEVLAGESTTVKASFESVAPPLAKPVSEEIPGVDILKLEEAIHYLWQAGIYAESGMGCTGPVILVTPEDKGKAIELLKQKGHL